MIWPVLAVLLYLAREDWRYRSVPIWSLIIYAVLVFAWLAPDIEWTATVTNLSFLAVQFLLVLLYFKLRRGSATKVLGGMLGWGDVVFILINAVLLSSVHFLAAYLLGLVGTLLLVILSGKHRISNYAIPLISGLAASHAVVLLCLYFKFW